jgi:hypothetical protein
LAVGALLLLVQREEFLAVNGNVARGFDAEADFAAINIDDRDTDVVADVNLLSEFAAQYEHGSSPSVVRRASAFVPQAYARNAQGVVATRQKRSAVRERQARGRYNAYDEQWMGTQRRYNRHAKD